MKTVSQIIGWVDQMLPNAIDSTTKYVLLEDIFKSVKEYNTNYVVSDTTPTASSTPIYSLPSGISYQDLLYVGISNTTFNTTNIVASSTPFTEYLYKNSKDIQVGSQWWEYSSTSIVIHGSPDGAYHMQFKYVPNLIANASSDPTTVVNCNDSLTDYIQHKLASQVARSGSFPRIDLANNYELEAAEKLTKAKIDSKKFKWRRTNKAISYKEWW